MVRTICDTETALSTASALLSPGLSSPASFFVILLPLDTTDRMLRLIRDEQPHRIAVVNQMAPIVTIRDKHTCMSVP